MPLLLTLLAVFVATTLATASLARLASHRFGRSTAAKAGWLVVPTAVAASICLALIEPGLLHRVCHCLEHGLHHPHVCLQHPDYAAALLVPASIVAGAWALLAVPRVAVVIFGAWQTWRWSRRVLHGAPVKISDAIHFRLVEAPGLGACTIGLLKPLIAVDSSLWCMLNDDERRAVLHHENAHRVRRDPLSLMALRICAALAPVPTLGLLLANWQRQAEHECDRHAVDVVGSPDAVASALLRLERYHHGRPRALVPLVASGAGADLERRVRALLDEEAIASRANLSSDVLRLSLVCLGCSLAFTLLAGDLVHHGAETVLGFLTHHH